MQGDIFMKRILAMYLLISMLLTACGNTSRIVDTDTSNDSGDAVTIEDISTPDTSIANSTDTSADNTADDTSASETVYYVESDGTVKSVVSADNVTVLGNCFLADNTLYSADGKHLYELMTPYYTFNGFTVNGAEYIEADGTIRFDLTVYEKPAVYTFYPHLPFEESVPDSAVEISRYETEGGLICTLLSDGEDYYYVSGESLYPENSRILKLADAGDCVIADSGAYGEARFTALNDGKVTVTSYSYLYTRSGNHSQYVGVLKMEYELYDGYVTEYNGAVVLSTDPRVYVIKDGEILHEFDYRRHGIIKVGEYLTIGENGYVPMMVLKPDLTLLDERYYNMFMLLTDGNSIGFFKDSGEYTVYSPDGAVVYESPDEYTVINVGAVSEILYNDDAFKASCEDYAFVKDSEGIYRLLTPYGEELCEFGSLEDNITRFSPMSGYHRKNDKYPNGCYFIFEDSNDITDEGIRLYEFYYSFKTGEHGLIDTRIADDYAYAKPVLYLYPTEFTDVNVKFEHPERLTVDYPAYNDGWNITAAPDGTLTDSRGREYYALYWEESSVTSFYDFADGFCVRGEDSAEFLEEKLSALGFTDKEANEFIIYWLPILESSEYNLIHFDLTNEREASNALHISPAPDSLLRVAMHIKAVDSPIAIHEQTLPSFSRDGFVAVEWGGCVH